MPYFDRFDVCEAYLALEMDFNVGGHIPERTAQRKRKESIGVQLARVHFKPAPSFRGYDSLSDNGREIYDEAVERLGLLDAPEYGGRKVVTVNPSDKAWSKHSYVLWFGQCGPTRLLVYAKGLEDAIEIAADWLADNAPGHIVPEWSDEHKELIAEVCKERGIAFPEGFEALEDDEARWAICDEAEADLTRTESGFLTSYEWGIELEDPTPAELRAFIRGES